MLQCCTGLGSFYESITLSQAAGISAVQQAGQREPQQAAAEVPGQVGGHPDTLGFRV